MNMAIKNKPTSSVMPGIKVRTLLAHDENDEESGEAIFWKEALLKLVLGEAVLGKEASLRFKSRPNR